MKRGGARIARRGLLATAVAPLLGACGFRPMYGPAASGGDGPAAQALAEISIAPISERPGQLLRLALQERFERAGIAAAHQYDLSITYVINAEQLSIQQDSAASWERMVGTANYTLSSQDPSRATITSGIARSVDGFNLFDNQFFAADLEAEAVQRRLAQAVAEQIALQLASFFARQKPKPASESG